MEATAERVELKAGDKRIGERARPSGGVLFDWGAIVVGGLIVGGFYLDAWAHNQGLVDDSFFTPWRAILYSGLFVAMMAAAGVIVWNHSRGYMWSRALPAGYDLSVAGVVLFMLGGLGDLTWHPCGLANPAHLLWKFVAFVTMYRGSINQQCLFSPLSPLYAVNSPDCCRCRLAIWKCSNNQS